MNKVLLFVCLKGASSVRNGMIWPFLLERVIQVSGEAAIYSGGVFFCFLPIPQATSPLTVLSTVVRQQLSSNATHLIKTI